MIENIKEVWLVWEYDDGVVPQKELWAVCATEGIANREAKAALKQYPAYTYEVEPTLFTDK